MIIQSFTDAILNDLPNRCLQPHAQPIEDRAFRQLFSSYLKECLKIVRSDTSQATTRSQASKAIR
jgi:hypothetical protein